MWSLLGSTAPVRFFAGWHSEVTLQDDATGESIVQHLDIAGAQQPSQGQVDAAIVSIIFSRNDVDAELELERMVETASWWAPKYQTGAELAARFRRRFRSSSRVEAARLAYWLVERVQVGDLTNNQVRNAFDMTVAEYTAFSTRMSALHDAYAVAIAAQGE